jgi:ADP-heptose:LPS heptosyltransferase
MKPLYSICILAHNRFDLTMKCLSSVFATRVKAKEVEIILVDNASTDETQNLENTKSILPFLSYIFIRREVNDGTNGYNVGLAHANGVYFVTLNNDMIVSGDWLTQMRRPFLEDPQMALTGGRSAPCYLNEAGTGHPIENGNPDYVEGSCMMALTHIVRKYGLFDQAYRFGYCEDSDLSLRLRKMGYHIAHVNASVEHLHSQTMPLAVKAGIDIDGFHAINHVTLRRRWGKYLKTRSFKEKILIRRTMAMGDVLLTTPVIRKLKEENCEAEIYVATEHHEVFKNNPDVAGVERAFQDTSSFDRIFNLDCCYENTPNRHIVDSYAEACGVTVEDYFPHIYPSKEERELIRYMFPARNYAVIHSGPHRGTEPVEGRTVSAELMQSIRAYLEGKGFDIYEVTDTLPLHRLAAVIEHASLFVGADSGPMHLAQAAMIPTVGIFGAVNPFYRLVNGIPFLQGVSAPAQNVGCLGCHHLYEPPMLDSKCIRTGEDFNRCMKRINPEDVFRAIEFVLEKKKMYLETSKIRELVLPHLVGHGLDIGCQRDPITPDCVTFDRQPWPEVTQTGDARKLPFGDATFDFVWSSHCLEDIPDTDAVLREWLRVLKPGGTIGLYVPHPELYKGINKDHVVAGFRPEVLCEYLTTLGCSIIAAVTHDLPGPVHPCHSSLCLARKA